MAKIAREAGVSKALLYHYFPSKREYFVATLQQAADELARRTEPDPGLPPFESLSASVDAYLAWIEENSLAYTKLIRSVPSTEEVRSLVEEVRDRTSARILDGLGAGKMPPGKVRTAVRARGCGTWTARSSTGSSTRTSSGPSCATCCSALWPARSRPQERPSSCQADHTVGSDRRASARAAVPAHSWWG